MLAIGSKTDKNQIQFPWKLFFKTILPQVIFVVLVVAITGLAARYFFIQKFISQASNQLQDTLQVFSKNIPETKNISSWCQSHSQSKSFQLSLVSPSGEILCGESLLQNKNDLFGLKEFQGAQQKFFDTRVEWMDVWEDSIIHAALRLTPQDYFIHGTASLSTLGLSLKIFDKALSLILISVALCYSLFSAWSTRRLITPMTRLLIKTQTPSLRTRDVEELGLETFGEWTDLESSIDVIKADLKAKSESLFREREEVTTLMASISDAILAIDLEGRPLFFNSKFSLLFDQSLPNKDGETIWQFFRSPEILEAFKETLSSGRNKELKAIELYQDSGGKKFLSLSISPLKNSSQVLYGAVGIFHDVTELKSAEQIRIDFVANVSHELRTPLTSIKGYTETILEDLKNDLPVKKEFVDVIVRNTDRLMGLISDLLDISALESTDSIQKTQIKTDEITHRILKQLQGSIESKQQSLSLEIKAPLVFADGRRLEQVLVNLLDNAHKYTPAKSKINVLWEENKNNVVLNIFDNGPGIPAEHHHRLFERFYRIDKARSRELGGTGLGLAIVKHIMQRHGGTVYVESQLGQGTRFVCQFPKK